jgi:hypothetical protein
MKIFPGKCDVFVLRLCFDVIDNTNDHWSFIIIVYNGIIFDCLVYFVVAVFLRGTNENLCFSDFDPVKIWSFGTVFFFTGRSDVQYLVSAAIISKSIEKKNKNNEWSNHLLVCRFFLCLHVSTAFPTFQIRSIWTENIFQRIWFSYPLLT